ncbi:MAG TPA: STAS domain-containing protein [Candidatus Acidoferrales bacterium]|nr:STAS domain-containing protein [Candidatus Acidoferrales bacterium]
MANDALRIHATAGTRDGHKILALKGPLTLQTVFEFQTAARAEHAPVLILDFTEVPYVDSAGLGAIVGALVTAQRAKRKLAVAGLSDKAKALVKMSHLGSVIHPYDTVQDAEKALE